MKRIYLIIIVFLIGWLASSAASYINTGMQTPFSENASEQLSPNNWIDESNIHVYNSKVVIDIDDPEWARFTDTNSMDPVFDSEANTIEIKPKSPDDIHSGDIIAYKSDFEEGIIVHRVVLTSEDSDGWYCRAKGDNIDSIDPGKIRFNQVQGVVVAIIY